MNEKNPEPITIVQNVSKIYRQGDRTVNALLEVDLTINEGTFVAVMGASGSGKSTLLHLMSGLTRPSAGTVIVADQDLDKLSDSKLTRFRRERIGLVFQAFNLIPSLNAYDNILFPLYAAGIKQPDTSEVSELADQLGIQDRLTHRPDSLSGGEQQRVAIARSLIANPAIVLADEPTGSLDSVTGQAICKLLRTLCDQQGRTIVVVTHESTVAAWADRVVVLKDGRILKQFEVDECGNALSLSMQYQAAVESEDTVLA
ncbi:ABC transporter ATP-binding protein [Novipirellula aureliae]|nr:ABC transporter ATP-binding protein [Novipirellula aureliae]